ncbi:MAG: hypothetical protein ACF8AM_12220 [Rhodopirellula sp. JB055]|uniref:hypothetical protein n=1 Tax=Rhodopirellula sp. JB055 TaxID=3342846 RepID=UPI00370BFECB
MSAWTDSLDLSQKFVSGEACHVEFRRKAVLDELVSQPSVSRVQNPVLRIAPVHGLVESSREEFKGFFRVNWHTRCIFDLAIRRRLSV